MKILMLFMILLFLTVLNAKEPSFEALRQHERTLVLREFKKLYKKREDIHQNMRQVLKHSRAKNLNKNRLNFFQPIKETHAIEASNVFFSVSDTPCEECGNESDTPDSNNDFSGEISAVEPGTGEPSAGETLSNDIRATAVSPWALK